MIQNDYEMNEYFNEEDRKRLSRMLMQSRAESKMSQEKLALEMGIAKKTVQNWERGISAPTLPQAIEWFRVMQIAPMPYFLQFVFPDIEGTKSTDDDSRIRKELLQMIETLPIEGIRQLMYMFYGDHGSSPRSTMNLVTAHLQTPLRDRLSHAYAILNDYNIAKDTSSLVGSNHIQPNIPVLEEAIKQARDSVVSQRDSYTLINNPLPKQD